MRSGWRGLQVYCTSANEAKNDELREAYKLISFVRMVQGVQQILIPLAGRKAFDVVEKWPLVQAFALEDVGGGGFFTLKHTVTDATPLLQELYAHADHLVLDKLVRQTTTPLVRHWNELLRNVSQAPDRALVDPNAVADPFRKYFEHAATSARGAAPRVEMHRGGDGTPTHMICVFGNPDGPVKCARTVLLDDTATPGGNGGNRRALRDTYLLLVELAARAIDRYTRALARRRRGVWCLAWV